jgi:hypothetical protein
MLNCTDGLLPFDKRASDLQPRMRGHLLTPVNKGG